MFDEGYQKITNIDISQAVTKMMAARYKEKGEDFKYLQMDVRAMDFPDGSFEAVIDKATLDSVLCGEGSTVNANKMISEIYRVLGPAGVYICVSYGQADYRMCYLDKPEYDWSVTIQQVTKPTISASITVASEDKDTPNVHFIYICQRGKRS
jgi:ubiquinone/menaquinone biosynthesis C-methylase UbiE